jgi:hypothetical protein
MTTKNILEKFSVAQLFTAVTAIVTFLGIMGTIFNQYSDVKYRITAVETNLTEIKIDLNKSKIDNQQAIKAIEVSDKRQDLDNAKIDTKLTNIEVTLQEIKAKLK